MNLQHDSRFELANRLARDPLQQEKARALYLEMLAQTPEDLSTWVNLGVLLFETGYTSAAGTAFTAAVSYHPNSAVAHLYLAEVHLSKNELEPAEIHFSTALKLSPLTAAHKASISATAHKGLASVYQRQGKLKEAAQHRAQGYAQAPCSHIAYQGSGKAARLLVLASANEGNLPWQRLIDRCRFDTTAIAVEYHEGPLPEADLIFNAIGDAELCTGALQKACLLLGETPALNPPSAVLRTGRVDNALRLGEIPGVITPRTQLISKSNPAALGAFNFPYLLRSQGFHGGNHFVRIKHNDALNAALDALPGEQLLAIEFLDARDEDGRYAKYRVMCIDGALYPLHRAVSSRWNVHYFSSDMDKEASLREQEADFLNDMPSHLGKTACTALRQIAKVLNLDYCGIDFGLSERGEILLYEANATMAINPPDQDEKWDYRRNAANTALTAAKRLLTDRISSPLAPIL